MSDPAEGETTGAFGELLLRPVRAGNAFEETVQRLLQTVRLGLADPGERLPAERELATMLGVSRDTLRDAIAALTETGFLLVRRGRYGGTFVSEQPPQRVPSFENGEAGPAARPTAAELDDVLQLRAILETGAARSAAERTLSPIDRERLWQALGDSLGSEEADYRRLDSRLHLTIGELVGSPSLIPLLADIRMRINRFLDEIPLLAPNIAHSNHQHRAVIEAILSGRGEAAAAAMTEHLEGSAALLRGFLVTSTVRGHAGQ